MTTREAGPLRIETLARRHRPLLKQFRNQAPSLVQYLQRFALRHAEKDLLARTYLAVDGEEEAERIAGYFSLATVSVERSSVEEIEGLAKLPRFPIPGVLLALGYFTFLYRQVAKGVLGAH